MFVAYDTEITYQNAKDRRPTRFEIRLPPELADKIDNWRKEQERLPNRAEAARKLIEAGLQALSEK